MDPTKIGIDQDFFLKTFAALAEIGRDPNGQGYQRLAWSRAEREAHRWFRNQSEQLGFEVWTDHAGNSFADFSPLADSEVPALTIGSHLDTVPYGGAFDGGLGVVAALTAAKAIRDSGVPFKRPLRVAAFTDEEGPRFGTGLLGSKAVSGALDMDLVRQAQDVDGIRLQDAMAEFGCDLESLPLVRQTLKRFYGYIELHIEQGPRLERAGLPLAAVTAVTGIRQIRLTFQGKSNHAGTTPKEDRQNTLRAAAETIAQFSAYVDATDNLVANPGRVQVHPNATNVVPGETRLDWDIRSPDPQLLDQATRKLAQLAQAASAPFHIVSEDKIFHDVPPCPLNEKWTGIIEASAKVLNLPITRLVSWAGHDAGVLGRVIPSAMIFVPSRDGISHAPEEFSSDAAMLEGTRLLTQTTLAILTERRAE